MKIYEPVVDAVCGIKDRASGVVAHTLISGLGIYALDKIIDQSGNNYIEPGYSTVGVVLGSVAVSGYFGIKDANYSRQEQSFRNEDAKFRERQYEMMKQANLEL